MLSRFVFVIIAVFFVVMNVLLWRAEFAGKNIGSTVPAEIVWRKILTAPDPSPLEIRHRGKRIGQLRWSPSVGEDTTARPVVPAGEIPPEGMIKVVTGYDLELEGDITLGEGQAVNLNFDVTLTTNYNWRDFNLRLTLKPTVVELHSVADEETVRLVTSDGDSRTERVFKFADLKQPDRIIREFMGPWLPSQFLAGLVPLGLASQPQAVSESIEWVARSDSLRLGTARVRGYRLEASFMGRYPATVFINTLGEIVRIDLPNDLVLINEGLMNL